jgi:hypothetical protein
MKIYVILMLRLFRRKMIFVVKYFRRNYFFKKNKIFFKNIFWRLVRTKKLRNVKLQLSPEFGNVDRPLSDSGKHVLPNLAKMTGFQSDSSGSGQIGRILAILAKSG